MALHFLLEPLSSLPAPRFQVRSADAPEDQDKALAPLQSITGSTCANLCHDKQNKGTGRERGQSE